MAKSASLLSETGRLACPLFLIFHSALIFGQTTEATLTGRITDAGTHLPIEGAQLWYQGNGSGPNVATDADGKYLLHAIPRGFGIDSSFYEGFVLTITAPGYATTGPSSSQKTLVRIKHGVAETRNFELERAARITGHLIDRESGKPIAGFYVQAIRRADARQDGLGNQSAPSGGNGTFTIGGLGPGEYALAVDPPMSGKLSPGAKKTDDIGYGPTWFPDVPRADMAAPVVLTAGENREIEMRLHKRDLHYVSGVFEVPEGMEADGIYVSVTAEKARTGIDGQLSKAGAFHIDGLEEGAYTIIAGTKRNAGHPRAFVSRRIEVTNRSVDDLKLKMQPGITLHALVRMAEENAKPPSPTAFLPFSLEGWMPDEGTQSADRMTMDGIPPGEYVPMLNNLDGVALLAVEYNGRPVPTMALNAEAPESTVTFVLTSRPGSVTGTVRDSQGNPVSEANIYLAPATVVDSVVLTENRRIQAELRIQTATSNENGRFHVSNVAAGKYRIMASPPDDGRRGPPDLHSAQTIEVTAAQVTSVDLDAGPGPRP